MRLKLEGNSFNFNEKHFVHTHRIAMGTKMAVAFSVISMADFKKWLLAASPMKPFVWKRFIGDIFSLWKIPMEVSIFVNFGNSFCYTEKSTLCWSFSRVLISINYALSITFSTRFSRSLEHTTSAHGFFAYVTRRHIASSPFSRECLALYRFLLNTEISLLNSSTLRWNILVNCHLNARFLSIQRYSKDLAFQVSKFSIHKPTSSLLKLFSIYLSHPANHSIWKRVLWKKHYVV